MALIENTDFSQKQQVDLASIASLYQRKIEAEQQMKYQQEQIKASKQNRFLEVIQLASNLTSKMVDAKAKKQEADAKQNLFTFMGRENDLVPGTEQGTANVANIGNIPTVKSVPFGTTPEFKTGLKQRLVAAAPEEAIKEVTKSLFEKGDGTGTLKTVVNPASGKLEYAIIKPNGESAFTGMEAPGRTPEQVNKLNEALTTRAEAYKENVINSKLIQMGKDINPLEYNTNDPRGISAKRALYAGSGLNLINQIEQRPGGLNDADKREMAELTMELSRVLTGVGVITNEQLHSLATNSGMKKGAELAEWLTNNPTGVQQSKFIERFKKTLERQTEYHSKHLENTVQKAIKTKYARLEKLAPEEFYTNIAEAGYNPDIYKQTKKLVRTKPPTLSLEELKNQMNATVSPYSIEAGDFKGTSDEDLNMILMQLMNQIGGTENGLQ